MNAQIHVDDEKNFNELLEANLYGKSIVSAEKNEYNNQATLTLSDGTVLTLNTDLAAYDGGEGDFFIDAINTVDNVIMSASVESKREGHTRTLELFVYTEGVPNQGQMVATVSGFENPYYGTGFKISVNLPESA